MIGLSSACEFRPRPRIEERLAPRRPLDDRTCAARAWHSAGRAARDTMADVCTSALAGTRRCRLLHNRGVDHAKTRDVLHRIPDRIAVPACPGSGLNAGSGRSLRQPNACGPSVASRTRSYKDGGSWSAIAVRNGVERWSSGSQRPAFVYSVNAPGCAELQRLWGTVNDRSETRWSATCHQTTFGR